MDTAEPAGRDAELLGLASAPDTGMVALEDGGEPVLATVLHRRVARLQAVAVSSPQLDSTRQSHLPKSGRMLAIAADDDALLYRISDGKARLLSSGLRLRDPVSRSLRTGRRSRWAPRSGIVFFAITGRTLTELLRVPMKGPVSTIDFSPDGDGARRWW